MSSKRPNVQPPSSSSEDEEASAGEDSSSESEEEEEQQPASAPPTKKPSPKSAAAKAKSDSKSPRKRTVAADDDEDEDEEEESEDEDSTIAKKNDLKKKEDEEEESSSEEEEDEEKAKQQPSKKPDSSDVSGSGSDADSDSDSEPSEKQAVANVEPAAEAGKKRQRVSAPSKVENSEKRRKLFERFWAQDDEIKILQAIIAFYSDKGSEPPSNAGAGADLDGIHELLLKKSLASPEFTKSQLSTKIRGLKRKFQTSASREMKKAGFKFSKPHDQEVYELSKKIWQPANPLGTGSVSVQPAKSKGKAEQEHVNDSEADTFSTDLLEKALACRRGDMSNLSIKKGLKLIDPAKARSLEERLVALDEARKKHAIKWARKIEEALRLIKDAVGKPKSG